MQIVHACELVEIIHNEKKVKVCFDKKTELYLSEDCKDIEKCFLQKKIEFKFFPDQSPGFSLCYQLEGKPFFARVVGQKEKVPMCYKAPYYVDQEHLFMSFKQVKP
ncbi:hypothetical protein ACJVC5_16620 [Peredibacter sp. HCB2-198]|uniref:hypothetical protein n=1 Tax=Peredibacter sp. HCB2-198 TaxID=3383025 RepID=UPI0038B4CA1F